MLFCSLLLRVRARARALARRYLSAHFASWLFLAFICVWAGLHNRGQEVVQALLPHGDQHSVPRFLGLLDGEAANIFLLWPRWCGVLSDLVSDVL